MEHFKNDLKLKRPLALITGASSGIGYELAIVFARNGYDLIVAAEDNGIHESAASFAELGGQVEAVQVDLSQSDGIDALCEKIEGIDRPVDSLVVNAGVGVSGEFVETDLYAEINMIKLNVISAVALAKFVVKDMVKRGEGRILFTSSIAADMPGPYYAVYAATKAFLQSFSEALRFEVKEKGVTVTALQPGATDTNFFARAGMTDSPEAAAKRDDPADVAEDGFNALMAGKDHVVAGSFKNKVSSLIGKILPETVGAKLQGGQIKPDINH